MKNTEIPGRKRRALSNLQQLYVYKGTSWTWDRFFGGKNFPSWIPFWEENMFVIQEGKLFSLVGKSSFLDPLLGKDMFVIQEGNLFSLVGKIFLP